MEKAVFTQETHTMKLDNDNAIEVSDELTREDRDFIEPVVRGLVDRLSVPFHQDRADLGVEGFETDEFGTFTVKVHGGRNCGIGDNTAYYLHQLGLLVEQARLMGVEMWLVRMWIDPPDDVWTATFGLDRIRRNGR